MINIPFRKYDFQIKQENGKTYILDEVRKKYLILSPEEWVRQNFIHYFIYDLAYPKSKIAVEKEFVLNDRKKRFDLLVFDKNSNPFLLVECKAQTEQLNDKVLMQGLQYNLHYKVPYLLISNGDQSFAWKLSIDGPHDLTELPKYSE